ncbi:MAG TPA: NBR1-Ig-like domain-containing protein [Anaerolineae bacterium]|nr:NBR1-Ig-like domain-containing protein [Anaerolineae bacterium]
MTENANPTPEPPGSPALHLPPRLARRLNAIPPHNRNLILYGAIAVLVTAGLLLPPVSLFGRIFKPCGELAIGPDSPAAQSADGLTVRQAHPNQSYRLTLTAVTSADFSSGAAGETLVAARDALPVNLMLESPVYQIAVCGEPAQPGGVSLAIPDSAQPVRTLDLYAWNSEVKAWSWIGGSKNPAEGAILASVDALPEVVALMQTTSIAPAIGAEVGAQEALRADLAGVVTELYPSGWVIAADGSLGGDQLSLPTAAGSQAIYPVVRNYLTPSQPNPDLVRGVLSLAETRQAHIDTLVALAAGYAGVTLDYQGLDANDRDAYTAFVADLSAALKAQARRLNVVVPQPAFAADGQADTAGYDWYHLGRVADAVQAPMNSVALIEWATAQVDRYKFQPILTANAVDTVNGLSNPISFKQAIERLGVVDAGQTVSLTANALVTFTLQPDSPIGNFAFDETAGVYRYEYTDKSSAVHEVTLVTAGALVKELSIVLPHYVRGVVVQGAAGEAVPDLADALRAYRQQSTAKLGAEIDITWQITASDGKTTASERALSESWLGWRAPAKAGAYEVSASIAGVDRGAVEVVVNAAAPEEEVLAVVAGAGSGGGTVDGDRTPGGAAADACYSAAYVADVTVPDGARFENNTEFTKTWKVRNNGTCAWDADTELAFVSGSQLGAPSTVEVGVLAIGREIEISVPMKTATQNGSFTGMWQLRNADGFYGQTLTVVINAGPETAPAAPPSNPAPAPVAPIGNIGSFEAGAHIDGFRRPDLLLYAGLKWIKIQTYAGVDVSGAIANAHAQGFKILLGIIGDKSRVMDPGYQGEYAAAVAAMAAAGADAIEVWNEPNINREWPTGQVHGANYTALLAKAYGAIKAANPGTLVISGAPAPTGYWGAAGCSPDGCNDDAFLAQMAAAGAASFMDCVGAHHNSGTTSPSVSSGRPEGNHYSWYFLPTLNLYYNSFGGARKVCFTELGYLSGEGYPDLASTAPAFAWARNTTVAQQAQWLAEAAAMSANSGKVRLMIIWNADFARYDSDPMAGYAIMRPGDSCPACDALRGVLGGR